MVPKGPDHKDLLYAALPAFLHEVVSKPMTSWSNGGNLTSYVKAPLPIKSGIHRKTNVINHSFYKEKEKLLTKLVKRQINSSIKYSSIKYTSITSLFGSVYKFLPFCLYLSSFHFNTRKKKRNILEE